MVSTNAHKNLISEEKTNSEDLYANMGDALYDTPAYGTATLSKSEMELITFGHGSAWRHEE
ncbi:hypothetical protein M8C21_015766 [Ambrosia artemisiifolia]|uniref:Uncharacterized protein n=1 Tax=Ambrosia artemisiifolia TaxID=4212 RepID=A0AAD5CTY1_AMBAR|nr:hypothetical protein M8C21_015766 [Ambrosia artemisiifolia]